MIIQESDREALREYQVYKVEKVKGGYKCSFISVASYLDNRQYVGDYFREHSDYGILHTTVSRPYQNKVTLIIYLKTKHDVKKK